MNTDEMMLKSKIKEGLIFLGYTLPPSLFMYFMVEIFNSNAAVNAYRSTSLSLIFISISGILFGTSIAFYSLFVSTILDLKRQALQLFEKKSRESLPNGKVEAGKKAENFKNRLMRNLKYGTQLFFAAILFSIVSFISGATAKISQGEWQRLAIYVQTLTFSLTIILFVAIGLIEYKLSMLALKI